jgi:hypothetical protein
LPSGLGHDRLGVYFSIVPVGQVESVVLEASFDLQSAEDWEMGC